MSSSAPAYYPFREELANAISHGIGVALAIAGLVVLVGAAALRGDVWHVMSFAVYGATMVALYTASTLYHSFRSPRMRHVLRIVDHSSIFLLIAGTYTPFTLVTLRGPWGWSLFGTVWGLAIIGIILKTFFVDRANAFSTGVYLLMGWLVVVAARPLVALLPAAGLGWLVTGGLLYSAGAGFYLWKRLPFHHAIFHLFVLGGSICHYVAVLGYAW